MISQGLCTVFKRSALTFINPIKIALYTADANLNSDTLVYTSDNEVVGAGYTAGGLILTPISPESTGTTAYASFENAVWPIANFICRGALIYDTVTLEAIEILDFGADKVAVSPFTITFPLNTADTAILRIY